MDYEILVRFLLAGLWGGLVGAEREYRSKSAGFRTMIMISVGACFFTMMSTSIGEPNNMDRIASNIVTGIGFLGAGVIFRGENRINGITTAATIWSVAAVGMGIGAGYYFAAACASVLILVVLAVLPYCEEWIDRLHQSREYTLQCPYSEESIQKYENCFRRHGLGCKVVNQSRSGDELTTTWQASGRSKSHDNFIREIRADKLVTRFDY